MLDDIKKEIEVSIRARYPIIDLVSWEETRVENLLREIAQNLNKELHIWSCSTGFVAGNSRGRAADNPASAIDHVENSSARAIFVFKDFHPFLKDYRIVRRLRDVVASLRKSYKTLVILSPVLSIPVELEKDITVFDIPLPTIQELTGQLKKFLQSLSNKPQLEIMMDEDLIERVVKATTGLTESEAENIFAKALVRDRKFTYNDLPLIIAEKKQIIRKSGLLEYYDLSESISNVGGLDTLKDWLKKRISAFTEKARAYGLPQPKGMLLLGVQGCGKSLTAKAVASLWKLPLLRLDVGSIFSSYIGSSEENMRKAIIVSESVSPTVLWLDEIEKGFSGLMGSGSADAGVSKRVFATFLTWLQEKTKPVFVIATANRIDDLPAELLRKGRFDDIFFIDLPNFEERQNIITIHLKKRSRDPEKLDVTKIARASRGYSGAEIEEAIVSAMYNAFPENRDINTEDIVNSLKEMVPISRTSKEQIAYIRKWAKDRARPASGAFYNESTDEQLEGKTGKEKGKADEDLQLEL